MVHLCLDEPADGKLPVPYGSRGVRKDPFKSDY